MGRGSGTFGVAPVAPRRKTSRRAPDCSRRSPFGVLPLPLGTLRQARRHAGFPHMAGCAARLTAPTSERINLHAARLLLTIRGQAGRGRTAATHFLIACIDAALQSAETSLAAGTF